MKINTSEEPFTIVPRCDHIENSCNKTISTKVRGLKIKNGLIICPECKEPLTGTIYLDL